MAIAARIASTSSPAGMASSHTHAGGRFEGAGATAHPGWGAGQPEAAGGLVGAGPCAGQAGNDPGAAGEAGGCGRAAGGPQESRG
jgi:hypothetical protein